MRLRELTIHHEVSDLRPLIPVLYNRPTIMPRQEGRVVICGYDQGLSERFFVCESLSDMQELYDKYAAGWALRINWYTGVLVKLSQVRIEPSTGITAAVIAEYAGGRTPVEVREAIAAYAMGNPGAARVLAERARFFETAAEVEALVGWPLSEHSEARSSEIWDRFK